MCVEAILDHKNSLDYFSDHDTYFHFEKKTADVAASNGNDLKKRGE